MESTIKDVEGKMDWLTGMACNHITFIFLESIIVPLLLVSIEWLIYYESTRQEIFHIYIYIYIYIWKIYIFD